jgi:hypothetical protein
MSPTFHTFTMQSFIQEHLEKNASGGAHGTHHVYWVPLKVFNKLPVTPWKFNRPPDMERVAEIRSFMKESKRVDGFIYLACINHQLVCYESNHRREALKQEMPDDMSQILVDVIWDATDDGIKAEFFRLNKAVSVPDLYVDNSGEESVTAVLAAVDAFCSKYPRARSTSGRPNRPGYNRDIFTQDFVRVMKELHISAEELLSRLEKLNAEMATRSRGRLTMNCVQKCEASGLWLFAWTQTLNTKELDD